jgi:hypothetical protein
MTRIWTSVPYGQKELSSFQTKVIRISVRLGLWSFSSGFSNSDIGLIRTMVVQASVIRTLVLFGLQPLRTSVRFGLW